MGLTTNQTCNVTATGGNCTDITPVPLANFTTADTPEEDTVAWIPYSYPVLVFGFLVFIAVSFLSRYVRTRHKRQKQKDYTDRNIDLRRHRLHCIMHLRPTMQRNESLESGSGASNDLNDDANYGKFSYINYGADLSQVSSCYNLDSIENNDSEKHPLAYPSALPDDVKLFQCPNCSFVCRQSVAQYHSQKYCNDAVLFTKQPPPLYDAVGRQQLTQATSIGSRQLSCGVVSEMCTEQCNPLHEWARMENKTASCHELLNKKATVSGDIEAIVEASKDFKKSARHSDENVSNNKDRTKRHLKDTYKLQFKTPTMSENKPMSNCEQFSDAELSSGVRRLSVTSDKSDDDHVTKL